jgi:ABC-type transporter Mla subunit MlaD
MVPGIPNGGGMMNPNISVVSGQALTGSNTLVNAQEVLATLKKNQEQIAAMEATIRKLQQELETAKKGAGK